MSQKHYKTSVLQHYREIMGCYYKELSRRWSTLSLCPQC